MGSSVYQFLQICWKEKSFTSSWSETIAIPSHFMNEKSNLYGLEILFCNFKLLSK